MEENNDLKISRAELTQLPDTSLSKRIPMGNYCEVTTTKYNSNAIQALSQMKKIPGGRYVDRETGEIRDYKHNTTNHRIDSNGSINESLKRLRRIILNNFIELEGWHIVLTYAKKMLEFDNAAKDFKKFYDNLKYHYNQYGFDYIRVIEPQESGSWHIHLLLKSTDPKKQIKFSNGDIQKLWKHDSVKVDQIYDVKGLSLYFTATNHEYNNDENSILSKSHIKQSRWRFYPSGARLYTKSKGIKSPKEIRATRGEIEKLLEGYDRSGGCSLLITERETGVVLNQVNYEYFNKK